MATMENFMTDRRCLLGKGDGSSLTLRDGREIDRARKRESQTERPRNRKNGSHHVLFGGLKWYL